MYDAFAVQVSKEGQVYSVSELNRLVKARLESDPHLVSCHVSGEISNFKHHSSGHMYFTLKDEQSRVRAVMFAGRNRRLRFRPEDGMRVICIGNIGVFDRDGAYQLYVDDMHPDGVGALYVQFEQLREKLQAEGLFAADRKRPLPTYPQRIGVVTSATGAVIRDICTTLERRYPLAKVILAPASVQGKDAAATIVRGLARLAAHVEPVDVIIVGRGGGSLEELWPFNEEIVARAIAKSPVPVVSAVGHETDVTISDFVADVRAATPTAAAELVAPSRQDLVYQLSQAKARSYGAVLSRLARGREMMASLRVRPVLKQPARIVQIHRQTVDYIEGRVREGMTRPLRIKHRHLGDVERRLSRVDFRRRLVTTRYEMERMVALGAENIRRMLERHSARLDRQIGVLEAMNPLGVLKRGYSVVYDEHVDVIISSVSQLPPGKCIRVQVADGTVNAKIESDWEDESGAGRQTSLDI